MMEAVRNGAWAKSGYTAKDYVQDGLYVHFSGKENAGYGVHEDKSTWFDLKRGVEIPLRSGSYQWNDDSLHMINTLVSDSFIPSDYRFIEVVYCKRSIGSADFVFGSNDANRHFVVLHKNRGVTFFDGVPQDKSNSLHPMPEEDWLDTKFYASCAYTDQGLGDPDQMYFNGEKEIPTGGASGWSSHNGLHPYDYRAECDLYEVRLYNRVLNPAEVAANYAVDKARFGLP